MENPLSPEIVVGSLPKGITLAGEAMGNKVWNVATLRKRLLAEGGVALGDVADVLKPGGRPKLYYIDSQEGTPVLSGRQILQPDVVGALKSCPINDSDTGWIWAARASDIVQQQVGALACGSVVDAGSMGQLIGFRDHKR